jgi:hypothetical protein
LRISGPGGQASAYVHVRRAGRSAVELAFDHFSGDWSFVGSANSRLRVSDGRTVLVAKNTYSRTESHRSGPPIISGIPYIGPMLGSESSSREESCYALYATVVLE